MRSRTLAAFVTSSAARSRATKSRPCRASASVTARPSMPPAPATTISAMTREALLRHVAQLRMRRVACRDRLFARGPHDADVGIVPGDPELGFRLVERGALVREE